ncbi:MAG: PilZ domain-containing protein [Planctomycetota bacterium]|jgi:hypothetical protein
MTTIDQREHERFRLDPMYTNVMVRRAEGMTLRTLAGHVYDVSEAGARIELDEPLELGEEVSADLELPGGGPHVSVIGRVVWVNDTGDDPGPRRMALHFERFADTGGRVRLIGQLGAHGRRAA